MDIERLAGTRLGNYEIESLLGRGGMGVVYRARQISLNRTVALKILPPNLSSDSSFVKRFHREAEAVAQLHHANIVQVYDIGEDQNLHFFSMEYMEGQTLDEVLKERGRLDTDEAAKIITQAASGVEHAHEMGILHRDIKPSNIILDRRGNTKVMDFGLARMSDDRSKLTQSGTLMGTLDYMSPEQCRGEELDERTDIYSLGVVLYEMLAGRVPFDAPNEAALIHKIISEEPVEANKLNPNISDDLSAIVSRAIEKNKDERYTGISEFLKGLRDGGKQTSSLSIEERMSSPSIAVLPFVNMSADPDQEYFCDGLAETIINELTQLEDLRVIARTSAFSFKGEKLDVREIGRKLDVKTVLEGSVQKAGKRVRITAQLVDTTVGHHLWSEKYDREMEDIFAIQDEITLAIVENLKPKLLSGERTRLAKRQTVDLEAYNLYLKGRWFWSRQTKSETDKAVQCFRQAIEKDPGYAPAHAGLAGSYASLPAYGLFPPNQAYPKAKEAAIKALKIDDTLARARLTLAHIKTVYDWDREGAEKDYIWLIKKNPGYANAHYLYGLSLSYSARFDEAIKQIELARELDPLSLLINRDVGLVFYHARKYEHALDAVRKAIEIDPNYTRTHLYLGMIYRQTSMYEEAMEEFQREKTLAGEQDRSTKNQIGITYALMGKKHEARRVLDDLLKQSNEMYVPPRFVADIHFCLEDDEEGFAWLEKAYAERDFFLIFLKVDPVFDRIRPDPRYIAMLKRIGLDQ